MNRYPIVAQSAKQKLSHYTLLLNQFGTGSEEARAFLSLHQYDKAFLQLARWATHMKNLVSRTREKI